MISAAACASPSGRNPSSSTTARAPAVSFSPVRSARNASASASLNSVHPHRDAQVRRRAAGAGDDHLRLARRGRNGRSRSRRSALSKTRSRRSPSVCSKFRTRPASARASAPGSQSPASPWPPGPGRTAAWSRHWRRPRRPAATARPCGAGRRPLPPVTCRSPGGPLPRTPPGSAGLPAGAPGRPSVRRVAGTTRAPGHVPYGHRRRRGGATGWFTMVYWLTWVP